MSKDDDKKWFAVSPGTMGLCALCIDLFGIGNVNPGAWGTPVYVYTTKTEMEIGIVLLNEHALSRNVGYEIDYVEGRPRR